MTVNSGVSTNLNGGLTVSGTTSLGGATTVTSGGLTVSNGNVAIGTNTANYKLHVVGDAYITGTTNLVTTSISNTLNVGGTTTINSTCSAVSFNATSDYRIKENVLNLKNKSSFTVDHLKPVTYTNKLSGKQDMGFIAHELQEHYPFLVSGEKDGTENQSVNYTGLIALLVKEIQELKQDIKLLKNI